MKKIVKLFASKAIGAGGDTTAPSVTGFAATSPSGLTIAITSFTASEAGVYFLITESATPPAAGAAGWNLSAPTTYTAAAAGVYTLYPWVKDAAGNVSSVYGSPVSVHIPTLYDQFTTDDAAPLTSPRTCEPIGTLTATDTGSKFSISSGRLQMGGRTGANDPRIYSNGIARAAGVVFWGKTQTADNTRKAILGWHSANNASPGTHAASIHQSTLTIKDAVYFGNITHPFASFSTRFNADYEFMFVLRTSGAFVFMKQATDYPTWQLIWVYRGQINTPMYAGAGINDVDNATVYDDFMISRIGSPFDSDYGFATQRLSGARTAGDTFTHEANCMIDFTIAAVPSGGNVDFRFRQQDATNYWQVTVDSTGALTLNEVVAGTPTQRGTSAGVIANGDVVRIFCNGTMIKVYEGAETSIGNLRITYTSATNFQTATAGTLSGEGTGGSVEEIDSWPITATDNQLSGWVNP